VTVREQSAAGYVEDCVDCNKSRAKTVLLISSHVVRGSVGSRVSSFVLERMGFGVWSLMTIILTWQPRQGRAHILPISADDFSGFCDDILASPFVDEIDAVMSGYFATPEQVAHAARLIGALKVRRPNVSYLCDPVMADEGGLYIDAGVATAIRDNLLPLADILKPNRSELEWICGHRLDSNEAIITALESYPARVGLVTSAIADKENATGNLLIDGEHGAIWLAQHPLVGAPVNGLGDLTATLFFSHFLRNVPVDQALEKATATVFDCLNHAIAIKANELVLAEAQNFFIQPVTPVTLTAL